MSDEELIEKAKLLLGPISVTRISGPSIEFLENILIDGFADEVEYPDEWERSSANRQRARIRELCILHQIL